MRVLAALVETVPTGERRWEADADILFDWAKRHHHAEADTPYGGARSAADPHGRRCRNKGCPAALAVSLGDRTGLRPQVSLPWAAGKPGHRKRSRHKPLAGSPDVR